MASSKTITSRVKSNILFTHLKTKDLNSLNKILGETVYQHGEIIFREGSSQGKLFLIEKGKVKISKITKYGEETVLAILHPDDFFGELEVIDGIPRSAQASAMEETRIVYLTKEHFDKLIKENHTVTMNLLRGMCTRLRTVDQTLVLELEKHAVIAKTKLDKMNLLIEATKNVNSTLDLEKLLGVILNTAISCVNADRGTLYLIDELKGELWSRVLQGENVVEIRLPIGKGLAGYVAQTGEIVNIPDAYSDPRFNPEVDKRTGYRTQNMLTMPLKNKDRKTIGVFQLLNKKGGPFTSDDEGFIDALSAGASIAIENARLAQEMVKSERLSAVGQMAGAIIHDIKNPMNTIRVYAQVMKKKSENEEAIKLADEMIRQVDRLVNMAQEILDFSRGVSATNIQEVELGEVMDAILSFIEKDLTKRNIQLVKDLKYTGKFKMDSDKMTRVFYNIASNAADAMPNGGSLTVSTKQTNSELRIAFKDTGTGMPPEVKARIFEPFVTYGKKHGTGLGMAIVKKVVDDHKGKIEIESEQGKGTTIAMIFPMS